MKQEIEKQFIEICKLAIEQKLKWEPSVNWSHNDFDELSVLIQNETGINLSRNTLKRIWGKMKYDGSPNVSTKNALANFAGYENWKDFMVKHSSERQANKSSKSKILLYLFILIGLILLGGVSFVLIKKTKRSKTFDLSKVHFSVRENTGEVPFSVLFDYDVSEIEADTVWIRHGWNPKDILDKEKNVRTILHFIPNYYCPELIADGQKIAEVCYHATTSGWIFLFPYATWEPRFYHYLDTTRGYLQMSPQELRAKNIDIADENHWVQYILSQEFGVFANDFLLETRLMNPMDSGGFTCQEAQIEICCERGRVDVCFTHKNCIKNAWYGVGDTQKKCIDNDLSSLGLDMNQWNEVSFSMKDTVFRIYKGDENIITDSFSAELGDIKAIKLHFRGCGLVDYLRLMDGSGRVVYKNDF